MPLPETRHERFEDLVERALAGLPPFAQRLLENVAIVIEDEPFATDDHDAADIYGLYEGVALTEYGAEAAPVPNKITLFRLPLEEDFADPVELEREVQKTVLHELAHHAGLDDDRLHALGY